MSAEESRHESSQALKPLFTVGHSNLEFPQFIKLLKRARVELLVDVRSRPHSSRFPQFSQPAFEKLVEAENMAYLFLGEELGGRPDDPDAYGSDGRVNYQARRKSYAFRAGVEHLLKELEHRALALMCAEEDPLECHRYLMICPELVILGIRPLHLRRDSRIETQEAAENRLLESNRLSGIAANTLFPGMRMEALNKAYELQAEKFSFRIDPLTVDRW